MQALHSCTAVKVAGRVVSAGALRIECCDDAKAAERATCDYLHTCLSQVVLAHGTARLADAGGSVLPVLQLLHARAPGLWATLALTFVDERLVAHADAQSNYGTAMRLGALSAPAPLRCLALLHDDELAQPSHALARVNAELEHGFAAALDITLLGLGEDGHIASLFPDRRWDEGEARVLCVEHSPKPPSGRITLSRSFIATARTHIVFAVGNAKRAAIARLHAQDARLPLTGLADVVLFTDIGMHNK